MAILSVSLRHTEYYLHRKDKLLEVAPLVYGYFFIFAILFFSK